VFQKMTSVLRTLGDHWLIVIAGCLSYRLTDGQLEGHRFDLAHEDLHLPSSHGCADFTNS